MNQTLFTYLNNLALKLEIFDVVVVFFAKYLIWVLVFSIVGWALYRLFRYDEVRWRELIVIFLGAALAWIIAQLFKYSLVIPRPFVVLDNVNLLFPHGDTGTFPSGHATFSFALATMLFYYHKQLAWLYIFGAFLIGASRVIAGVHWPLDILGGYALGGVVAFGVYHLYKRLM